MICRKGRLELILGCMFSGKTTEMFSRVKESIYAGKKATIIVPDIDKRYTKKDLATSHDGQSMRAIRVSDLLSLPFGVPNDVKIIGIDEGHFLEGLASFCKSQTTKGVDIVVAALNSDANRNLWPIVQELIPLADDIVFRHGVCVVCHEKASCSKKIVKETKSTSIIDVGGDEKYVATCSNCFHLKIPNEKLNERKKLVETVHQLIKSDF